MRWRECFSRRRRRATDVPRAKPFKGSMTTIRLNATSVVIRTAAIACAILAVSLWGGLGGSMRAAPPVADPVTCVPSCEVDGRSLVSAGDDNTTLSAQEIVLGLSFTQAAGPDGNFDLYDGDRDDTN